MIYLGRNLLYTLFTLSITFGSALFFSGCTEETNPVETSPDLQTIHLRFAPYFGTEPLQLGEKYLTTAGDTIVLTTAMFYASEYALVNVDGSESTLEGITLVDFGDSQLSSEGYFEVDLKGEEGTYRGLKFNVGVPFDQNHRDVSTQSEPLGPNSGMYWSWNPGYIFFKVEGRVDSIGTPVNFLYHTGEDNRRKTIRLASLNGNDITEFVVEASDGHTDHEHNVFTVKVDYSKFFEQGVEIGQPMQVKMKVAERTNHVGPKDLADRTAANFAEMFSWVGE
ncbi:MAG: hypothetical protein KDD67_14825 [Ignavibacteriae bacterium]|nr:hypothetical protein [Ignavibacteriota bacterium]MCB9215116.1 hypothetical protein [Ignavibacteria bacterium]